MPLLNFTICILIIIYIYCIVQPITMLGYSMIKELNNNIYVGGMNYLSSYTVQNNKLVKTTWQYYTWPVGIMNGSDIGFPFPVSRWPAELERKPSSMAFDTCLNWKQEHKDPSVRDVAFDYQHWRYHTPSGDWVTMNYTCMNSFIRSVEILDDNTLWVCGTFGTFPRAFAVHRTSLLFIKFVDINMMSCARYLDEPMATYRDVDNNLYVASGWGLYRPDKKDPDIPDNNSTMLYADWRLYRNLFTLPSAMAWVLSSDVNFINVVKETKDHLYFFGHEINNQYGLNNQEDRHAWQSFMLRICKKDLGFKYVPVEIKEQLKMSTGTNYFSASFESGDYHVSPLHEDIDYNKEWYHQTAHLPTKHFVTPLKINFGCYIGKRPRAISDNHFWGDTNVVYLNRLADVIFDPSQKIRFKTSNTTKDPWRCTNERHHQIPLVGIFNREGLVGTNVGPTGALCQLQINENIFNEMGSARPIYNNHNIMEASSAHEELMALSSTSVSNFYSRTLHRTNGYTLHPYWNQGVLIGDSKIGDSYKYPYKNVGKCENTSFYQSMDKDKFLKIQNFSNIGWPNELANRLSSIPSSICQYPAAELYSFNASFVVPGVEFKKIYLIKDNITDYVMHKHKDGGTIATQIMSPLMVIGIISTSGRFYRVVLCDFDNAMRNRGEDHTSGQWYNWCIFRHTDQPYLYRQYTPMERREWGESYQYRASSLLLEKTIVDERGKSSYPINRDPQFHVVKDILRKGDFLHVLTTNNIHQVNIKIDCTTYTRCIDCASDPDCMWNIGAGKCGKYKVEEYKDTTFVQDVLDRGMKCAAFIKASVENRDFDKILTLTDSIRFVCNNSGMWRGKVQWRINDKVISQVPHKYSINGDDHYLIVMKTDETMSRVSCHGVRDDHDKLYGNIEYDWIMKNGPLDNVALTMYRNIPIPENSFWTCIIFIILLLLLVLVLIIVIVMLYKCPEKVKPPFTKKRQPVQEPFITTDVTALPLTHGQKHLYANHI